MFEVPAKIMSTRACPWNIFQFQQNERGIVTEIQILLGQNNTTIPYSQRNKTTSESNQPFLKRETNYVSVWNESVRTWKRYANFEGGRICHKTGHAMIFRFLLIEHWNQLFTKKYINFNDHYGMPWGQNQYGCRICETEYDIAPLN